MHNPPFLEKMHMDLTGVKGESIGHLGLVAATIQDMDIMDKVDEQLGWK